MNVIFKYDCRHECVSTVTRQMAVLLAAKGKMQVDVILDCSPWVLRQHWLTINPGSYIYGQGTCTSIYTSLILRGKWKLFLLCRAEE